VFARQATDHLDPPPALAEGALEQVCVTHALAVLDRKVKEGGQRAEIGDKAVDCTRVASAVLALEVGRAGIGDPDRLLARSIPARRCSG
jgi:hypothetical protein